MIIRIGAPILGSLPAILSQFRALQPSPDGRILLQGNNGVSIAMAFNWYLKYFANCEFSECAELVPAWQDLLAAAPECRSSDAYRYDLADVTGRGRGSLDARNEYLPG
jgi:hypothetical protein